MCEADELELSAAATTLDADVAFGIAMSGVPVVRVVGVEKLLLELEVELLEGGGKVCWVYCSIDIEENDVVERDELDEVNMEVEVVVVELVSLIVVGSEEVVVLALVDDTELDVVDDSELDVVADTELDVVDTTELVVGGIAAFILPHV